LITSYERIVELTDIEGLQTLAQYQALHAVRIPVRK
jgi:hypothetical protein